MQIFLNHHEQDLSTWSLRNLHTNPKFALVRAVVNRGNRR